MKQTQFAYDDDGNLEYRGVYLNDGHCRITRYWWDADGNIVKMVENKKGAWNNRESMDWA